jgi:hypothetical protein
LLEKPVVGQYFVDAFSTLSRHGDAIREAGTLVWSRAIELQSSKKRISALCNDLYERAGQKALDAIGGRATEWFGRTVAKKVRYSANTSSVVTMCEPALSFVRARAR